MRFQLKTLARGEARLPLAAITAIVVGAIEYATGSRDHARVVWLAGLVITGIPVVWRTLRAATRGHFATDVVAMLAITGAVILGEPVAGLIVVLMQTGGEALERLAAARASAAIRALEEAAPRIAHRVDDGAITDVAVDDVAVGEILLVRPGELVPCDALVVDGRSHLDTSALTGEPMPTLAEPGATLMSGSVNQEGALTVRATALARESQYARIVELVRAAQESKAPLQRLADRYAVWFTPITLAVCAAAYLGTGSWVRVLAVLVVATPCPLILATPVAIIGGINRAARRHIIVRHGGALEALSRVDTAIFDKTGTLTVGRPEVSRVIVAPGWNEDDVVTLAAAVEQGSGHLLARSVVRAAESRGYALPPARRHVEIPGRGLSAEVDGREVTIGARAFVMERHHLRAMDLAPVEHEETGLRAYVVIDGAIAGVIEYADQVRPGMPAFLARLAELGVRRTVLLSGDHTPNVRQVAHAVGIEDARGDLLPEGKVSVVRQLGHAGARTLMVGDGTNDAPALSSADVGVALAGHGGGVTAEAADVVILTDDLPRVAEAVALAQRTLRIARESIWVGLGLSAGAMVLAARGLLPPTVGALVQEGIDIAAIVNALRASAPAVRASRSVTDATASDAVAPRTDAASKSPEPRPA